MHFTKSQRRQRRDTSDHLRRSSIFSDFGPFAGIQRFYSKNSDTGTDTDGDKKKSLRKKENIIRLVFTKNDKDLWCENDIFSGRIKLFEIEECENQLMMIRVLIVQRGFPEFRKLFFFNLNFSSRSTEHSRHNNVENIYDTIKNESSS